VILRPRREANSGEHGADEYDPERFRHSIDGHLELPRAFEGMSISPRRELRDTPLDHRRTAQASPSGSPPTSMRPTTLKFCRSTTAT
jgi:hypothetical protein